MSTPRRADEFGLRVLDRCVSIEDHVDAIGIDNDHAFLLGEDQVTGGYLDATRGHRSL